MNPAELALQVAATTAFILADAEEITLTREQKTPDGAGGYVVNPAATLAPQIARLIPQSDRVPEITGADGRSARPEWVILMEPESDLLRYDRFQWRGVTWEVAQIHIKPDYEKKGDVIRYV